MASNASKNRRRRPAPRPTEGNLARKLDSYELERRPERSRQPEFERQYRRPQETAMERRSRQRAAARAAVRAAQKLSPGVVVCFAATAALTVLVLLCYVRLNAISRSIVDMKSQIQELETQQVSLLTRYEQAFDLTSVKESAEAAGMTQPSDSQIYYIDLPGENRAVSYGDNDLSFGDRIVAKVKTLIEEIKEYFQ